MRLFLRKKLNKKDLYKDSDCYKAEGYCVNHRYKYYEISAKKEHSIETIANEMINIFDNNVLNINVELYFTI